MAKRSGSVRASVIGGCAVVVLLILFVCWWFLSPSSTASPGLHPAAPPAPGQAGDPAIGKPTDGVGAHLTGAQADAIRQGKEVNIAMPGGGSITVGPPTNKSKQPGGGK